jgi:hypothetical protein
MHLGNKGTICKLNLKTHFFLYFCILYYIFSCLNVSSGCASTCTSYIQHMDEGTLEIPIPQCRLYWSFLFGVVKQFCSFNSGQSQSVKLLQNMVWEGGGEVREKVEGQQCTSIVPSSMGATVHKLGRKKPTMSECISSL